MNHYHSDHITEDKEARIQERLRRCYARAYWEQRERYVHIYRMVCESKEHEIYIKKYFDESVYRPKTEVEWNAAGFRRSYREAREACQTLLGMHELLDEVMERLSLTER